MGRLVLWALELTQFDIRYKARTTIKAQTLADFIVEFGLIPNPGKSMDPDPDQTNPGWPEDSKIWVLYTDGASNQLGCRAGIILIDPVGIEVSHCFRFEFRATNNEAEYEALLAGMKVAGLWGLSTFRSRVIPN